MIIKIPDFQKIVKPDWLHKAGFGISIERGGFVKQKIANQSTIPADKKLLKKLGIKKRESVLAIAGYYADWASALKTLGAEVDYSDISRSLVNHVKKNVKIKFRKYICLGYEYLPKKAKEYDWTFTYEACGGKQGLPIAYLRALLNNQGGILMVYTKPKNPKSIGNKLKTYPDIVNTLSRIYKAKKKVRIVKIQARRKEDSIYNNKPYLVCKIITNNSAREQAELDIKLLENIGHKNPISLEREAKKLKVSKEAIRISLTRINRITRLFNEKFVREINIKK